MISIVTELSVPTDKIELFVAAVRDQAKYIFANNIGCIQFDICQSEGKPEKMLYYEVFENWAAYETHINSDAFAQFMENIGPLLNAEPIIRPFEHLPIYGQIS